MKKITIIAIALFMFAVGNAFAQSTADVAVTAVVQDALTLTPTAVAFGTIQANAAATIEANTNDPATNANLGTGATAGALQIEGTTGVDVTISWANATLTDGSGANPTTFTPVVYNGASAVTSGASDLTITGGDITLNVGGTLAAIANPGSYSTGNTNGVPVVFTVQYTSL
ncbi:MAG: hypothetical protein EA360_11055 [Balneolaceae bacterium]|nr:MAG: hypothetical protein EA360_11055 [Balneolaceae bacterium]